MLRAAWALLLNIFPAWAAMAPRVVGPRYLLCGEGTDEPFPSAELENADLQVYAASIAGTERRIGAGRQRNFLELRAALLVEGSHWEARGIEVDGVASNEGHAADVSYAKCFGDALPNSTKVRCRVDTRADAQPFAENASWVRGRLSQFSTSELRQDFALCPIRILALGAPKRLRVQLSLRLPASPPAVLDLKFCRVEQPLFSASFCSQPLWGFDRLREQLPWVMEDWLAYHLQHFGFQHAELYDVDGSFAEALEPWLRGQSLADHGRQGSVSYHRSWPAKLSKRLLALSQEHPYCAEMFAYAHCVTTHRALSRWVALLHAPDEYVTIRSNSERGALLELLQWVESTLPQDQAFAFLQVNAVSFGRGGPGADEADQLERGGMLVASRMRTPGPYHHMPLIDPANCICAGPHSCFKEVGNGVPESAMTLELRPGLLLVHHYVEMLPQNSGRCGTMNMPCQVPDWSADTIVHILRSM